MGILIENIEFLSLANGPVIERGSIRIEGQKIVAVGDVKPEPGDEILSGRDRLAMPGLVNSHNHAAMVLLRGYADDLPLMQWLNEKIFPAEERLTGEDIYWGTLLAHLEMIKGGTTSYADMYFFLEESIWAMEESGIRASLALGATDGDGRGEEKLANTLRIHKEFNHHLDGRLKIMLGPHSPYTCSEEYLRRNAEVSRENGIPIHIHIAETLNEMEIIEKNKGMRVVPYLNKIGLFDAKVLAAHMVHVSEEEMDILKEKNVGLSISTQSEMKLASGIAPVAAYLKKGLTVGLATDGASSNNDLDMWEEMRTTSFLQKVTEMDSTVLSPYETLTMGTIGSAKAMDIGDEVGALEPGKKADIILLDLKAPHFHPRNDLLSHLLHCGKAADVDTVIIDGKILMEKREMRTIDEEKIVFEAEKRAGKLLNL